MKKWNYYNDSDPKACAWVRELIKAGCIPDGEVDNRPIQNVQPEDLHGFVQHHWFCGIAGWARALDLAGWPRDRPVWTASLPCQPFSTAGTQRGQADERHLYPVFAALVEKCRPERIFGEQVEAAIRHGWLDLVQSDLEGIGYAFAATGLPAACVGAPHIRQRLWFVGDAGRAGLPARQRQELPGENRDDEGRAAEQSGGSYWRDADWLPCRDGKARPTQPGLFPLAHGVSNRVGRLRAYGNAIVPQVAAAFIGSVMS